jgi:hypothetical protein
MLYLRSSGAVNEIEGVWQSVDLKADQKYCFSVDAAGTDHESVGGDNGDLTMHIMFYNEVIDLTCGFPTPNSYPKCQPGAHCIDIGISNANVYPDFVAYTESFTPSVDYHYMYTWTSSSNFVTNNPTAEGAIIDNFALTCENQDLQGAISTMIGSCEYQFEPDIANISVIAEIEWDFGDGNFSTLIDPKHKYANSGTYNVVVNIKDVNGCCATAETIVVCDPTNTFHLCWSHNFDNNMQRFNDESYIGLRVEEGNSSVVDYPYYPGGTSISTKHMEIYGHLVGTLSSVYGIPAADIDHSSNMHGCNKGGVAVAACYVVNNAPLSQITKISMYGNGTDPSLDWEN